MWKVVKMNIVLDKPSSFQEITFPISPKAKGTRDMKPESLTCDLPEMGAFFSTLSPRRARKASASSRRKIASQRETSPNAFSKPLWIDAADVPSSPPLTL